MPIRSDQIHVCAGVGAFGYEKTALGRLYGENGPSNCSGGLYVSRLLLGAARLSVCARAAVPARLIPLKLESRPHSLEEGASINAVEAPSLYLISPRLKGQDLPYASRRGRMLKSLGFLTGFMFKHCLVGSFKESLNALIPVASSYAPRPKML